MKASELVAILKAAISDHGDREVKASWEGITPEIVAIYIGNESAHDGEGAFLLDSDNAVYLNEYADEVIWRETP